MCIHSLQRLSYAIYTRCATAPPGLQCVSGLSILLTSLSIALSQLFASSQTEFSWGPGCVSPACPGEIYLAVTDQWLCVPQLPQLPCQSFSDNSIVAAGELKGLTDLFLRLKGDRQLRFWQKVSLQAHSAIRVTSSPQMISF